METPLRIFSLSDLHLGHNLVSSEHIISNLNKAIPDSSMMLNIDIIFLCGDIFDCSLALPDANVGIIQLWISRLLKVCKKWDICLRILNGTSSHDRKQSKQFEILNTALSINCDLKYIDILDIEYIEKFNINILYIPDEWRGDNEQTKEEVKALLSKYKLDQVDYAIMHGNFPHQLPPILHVPVHDTEFYLKIVKKYIFIGHIHIMSQYERILAQGSFDRLAHNEEHSKGFFFVESYPNSFDKDRIIFRINKSATIFLTAVVAGLSKEDTELELERIIKAALNENSDYSIPIHIRVVCEKNDNNEDVISSFRKSYVQIKWTSKVVGVQTNIKSIVPSIYIPTPINDTTILSLIKNRLVASGVDSHLIANSLDVLNELKGI